MRRLLLSGLMVLAFSVTAFAGVDVSKLQLPGDITQAQADTVIKGALAKAKEQGVPMNIAVVDAGGNLKAFTRMDGAFLGSIDISIGKARTARLFNMPTSALGAASQPVLHRGQQKHHIYYEEKAYYGQYQRKKHASDHSVY